MASHLIKRALLVLGSVLFITGVSAVAKHHSDQQPKQAMFKTQKAAEAAAPGFGCEGAHRMGSMWMVCAQHDQAEHHGQH